MLTGCYYVFSIKRHLNKADKSLSQMQLTIIKLYTISKLSLVAQNSKIVISKSNSKNITRMLCHINLIFAILSLDKSFSKITPYPNKETREYYFGSVICSWRIIYFVSRDYLINIHLL